MVVVDEAKAAPGTKVSPVVPQTERLQDVKVKLPVDTVLRMHYARMTKRKNFSQMVSTALDRYLDDLNSP